LALVAPQQTTSSSLANIGKIPELRRRLLFTVAMLAVYRVGVFITTPGVDRSVMKKIVGSSGGTLLGMLNMFSGGALEQLSIFALGIMPYISSSIILQLMTVIIPKLDQLNKEGEQGRRKITQYTRYGTVLLSIMQSIFIAAYLQGLNATSSYGDVVLSPGIGFYFLTCVTLTTGTAFIMWLGEQITERGIGNGISLIIFSGIVARMPDALFQTFTYASKDILDPFTLLLIIALVVAVIAVIIFFERGQRRIPVQYAKRMVGRRLYGGSSMHLPLKVNSAGVIPPIFASSILLFPTTMAGFLDFKWLNWVVTQLNAVGVLYNTLYVSLIVFFCYFYTAIQFNPMDVADNLKKNGGFIPGIRPGKRTAEYIDRVLTRITFGGALYISAVCILPQMLQRNLRVPFHFGGTALLIVVGVALDTAQQIEQHLITRHYDGFAGKGKRLKGRRG